VRKEGLGVLGGFGMVNQFFEHAALNFVGAGCALVALFAEVGSLVVGSVASSAVGRAAGAAGGGDLAVEAMAQASAVVVLSHLVSLAFLVVMIRKVTDQTAKVAEWAENLRKAMPGLA